MNLDIKRVTKLESKNNVCIDVTFKSGISTPIIFDTESQRNKMFKKWEREFVPVEQKKPSVREWNL